jgi:4-hydroxy-tetrahydrodipicolinate synthase
MMTSPEIVASGVISVTSNIAPRAISDMAHYILDGNFKEAKQLFEVLQPLFAVITVKTQEQTPFGAATVRARNPLATKTLMNVLGMPAGPCRQPLGKMTRSGLEIVLQAARKVYEAHPEIFRPIEKTFNVDLMDRLNNGRYLEGLYYA